jgi:hypothetical protein
MPATPFLSESYVKPYISSSPHTTLIPLISNSHLPPRFPILTCACIVGITFAVAVPLIIAAFGIQSIQNTCKRAWTKVGEKRKERKERKRRQMGVDDDIPDFLK